MEYKVIVAWDAENSVFHILESDIEGLWLEAPDMDALKAAIRDLAPDLLKHNHNSAGGTIRVLRDVESVLI